MNEKTIIKRVLLIASIIILSYYLLTNFYYPITLTHIFNMTFIVCFVFMIISENKKIYIIIGIVFFLFAGKNCVSNTEAFIVNQMVFELMMYIVSCILMGIVLILMAFHKEKKDIIILLSILTIGLNILAGILQARTSLQLVIRGIPFTVAIFMPAIISIVESKNQRKQNGS